MYIPHMTQVTKHANEAMVINIRTLVAWLQGDWLERDEKIYRGNKIVLYNC